MHLRERDEREIYNVRPHREPLRLAYEAHHIFTTMGRGRVAWWDGRPAGVLGFFEQWPGMWEAVAFGTDAFKSVAFELARYGRQEAQRLLREVGANRLQADAHIDNIDGHGFIRLLGGQPEFVLRRYGRDGSDYQRFVWFPEVNAPGWDRAPLQQEAVTDVLWIKDAEPEGATRSADAASGSA